MLCTKWENVPIKLWIERSRRHGSINSAAVGTISTADFSGLARVEYCLTKRAFDASNPGKFAMCAISELLLVRSESAIDLINFEFQICGYIQNKHNRINSILP